MQGISPIYPLDISLRMSDFSLTFSDFSDIIPPMAGRASLPGRACLLLMLPDYVPLTLPIQGSFPARSAHTIRPP